MTELFEMGCGFDNSAKAIEWAYSLKETLTRNEVDLYARYMPTTKKWSVLSTISMCDKFHRTMMSGDREGVDQTRYAYMREHKRITKQTSKDILIVKGS